MSVTYRAVHWNPQKRLYDTAFLAILALSAGSFVVVTAILNPNLTLETLVIRTSAFGAFALLHVVLCIGPLARLDRRFLWMLYNRRHLGVATCLVACVHAAFAVIQYHAYGDTFPLISVFTAYQEDYAPIHAISDLPFEPFGAFALVVLLLMAATSHDFWLRTLGASWWKTLHVFVYLAYGALVVHVAYGFLQSEQAPIYPALLAVGLTAVVGLHVAAFVKELRADWARSRLERDGFQRVCSIDDLAEGRGHAYFLKYDRVAVYLVSGRVYALSNVCRHQGGPIGEGRIVDGLVTCPWHGWTYRVDDGTSPPPFHEVIPTYNVRVQNREVFVRPEPNPLGAKSNGASAAGGASAIVPTSTHPAKA